MVLGTMITNGLITKGGKTKLVVCSVLVLSILLTAFVGFLWYRDKREFVLETLEYEKRVNELSEHIRERDSIVEQQAKLIEEIDKKLLEREKTKTIIQKVYENNSLFIDTLSIDGSILFLSKFLSEEDSIRY